jgi:hypothetical protein
LKLFSFTIEAWRFCRGVDSFSGVAKVLNSLFAIVAVVVDAVGVDVVGDDDVSIVLVVTFVGCSDVGIIIGIVVVSVGSDAVGDAVGDGAVFVDTVVLLFGIKILAFGDR